MHIFITGGTRGIGHALVKAFLKEGHQVSYTGTSQASVDKSVIDLVGDFERIICDVRHKDQIIEAKDQALERFGDIHIWINNAGVDQARHTVDKLTEEEINRVININLIGSILGTSVVLELFKKQGFGYVYNFEGLGSNGMKIPETIVYGTTKRAITYFSKACNKEIKEYPDVFVGLIQPGMVFTDLLLNNMTDEGMRIARILGDNADKVAKFVVKGVMSKNKNIKYLTNLKIGWRFLSSPFKKNTGGK